MDVPIRRWCSTRPGTVRALAALAALLLASPVLAVPVAAQGTATAGLRGRVVDTNGTPVEGAAVSLTHVPTGGASSVATDANGRYYLPNQRPGGPYRLTVTRIGFADFASSDLQLLLGQFVDFDVVLEPEAIELEPLRVEVEQDLEFNPGRIGLSTTVTSEVLEQLPTITRNFVDFAALSPLAHVSDEGVSVIGANYRFNNLRVDGALNQDVFGLSTNNIAGGRAGARVIPLDAIEQFQVLVSPFDVRESGFTGGVLNAVTKSGTNDWEGTAFGFFRNEALVGDVVIDREATSPENLDTVHGGFTVGGPIERDRAHFFVAGEWERVREPPDGYNVGEANPFRTGVIPDSIQRVASIARGLGLDPGTAETYTTQNTIGNLFGRVDWSLGEKHDAMVRYSFASADDDPAVNRLPGEPYDFSSQGTHIRSRTHSVVFQLFSTLGDRLSNELLTNVQFVSERETAMADFPRLEVEVEGLFDDELVRRGVRLGANAFGTDNALDQRILQVTDNLSYALGSHQLLVGVSATRFDFDRRFVPNALGNYRYASLADFDANRPDRYEITIPLTPDGAEQQFGVWELGAYLQDEWALFDALTLRAGLRVDVPVLPGGPERNPLLRSELGIDNSRLPSGRPTLSPRMGLNWRPFTGTQVRAGMGIFTGRPAFAWLANAYGNTGASVTTLLCEGDQAPAFAPGATPPTACVSGVEAGTAAPIVNVFDPDFRFPQDLRSMVAVDQRLPGDFVLSASWMYNRAVNQIFIEDANLANNTTGLDKTVENGFTPGFGFGVRDVFGAPARLQATGEGVVLPSDAIFAGGRWSGEFAQVLRVTNRDENFSYALSFELKKRFGDRFGMSAGYSYTRSADLQSLTSLDVTSNMGNTPLDRHPNHPVRQPSLFDRPGKIVANAFVRLLPQFGGTDISLLYVGQSGVPYSYVYLGDVNGDGYPGPRAQDLANDLVWVPELGSDFPGSIVNQALWAQMIGLDACLDEQVLKITPRNSCRTPWSNQLDLRITQHVRTSAFSAEVMLDLLNVLNIFDRTEGVVWTVNPAVQLFRVRRYSFGPVGTGPQPARATWVGPTSLSETGKVRAALPWAPEIPTSQWRMQLGIRLRFGPNR